MQVGQTGEAGTHPDPAPPGERLFAAYLGQRPDLTAGYEVLDQGRRPDFTVDGPHGTVVCEIFNPRLDLPNGSGSFDPITPLRGSFGKRKRRQGAGSKQKGVPYVVVVGRENSDVPFDEHDLLIAAFGRGGGLNSGKNTRYSALAVVSSFNPTQWRVEALVAERLPPGSPLPVIFRIVRHAEEELLNSGVYDPAARVARLRVVHNPWARVPLSSEVFGGPHDEQFIPDTASSEMPLIRVASGWRAHELLRY
jgi:hypothetical protein